MTAADSPDRREEALERAWKMLRALARIGVGFRRDAEIGPYGVDFLHKKRAFVVEIGGAFDPVRAAWLQREGLFVWRVEPEEVFEEHWIGEVHRLALARPERAEPVAKGRAARTAGAPQRRAPQRRAPEQRAPEQAAPEQAASEQAASEQAASEQAASEQYAPERAAPAHAASAGGDEAAPFWKRKTLTQMSEAEWESLCDGCGKCCLIGLEDEDSGEIHLTDVACKLFDPATCQCSDYANRKKKVPDCVKLTPESVPELYWLPKTCAYRLVAKGEDLKWWHPLVSGDPQSVHEANVSVRGKVRLEKPRQSMRSLMMAITKWPDDERGGGT